MSKAVIEYKRFISKYQNQFNEYERKIAFLILNNFKDVESTSSTRGNRAKTIVGLLENQYNRKYGNRELIQGYPTFPTSGIIFYIFNSYFKRNDSVRILILILILLLAALLSKGIEKIVRVSNKTFINALFFLFFGLISSVTYFLIEKELQIFVFALIIIGFAFTIVNLILGFWQKDQDKTNKIH